MSGQQDEFTIDHVSIGLSNRTRHQEQAVGEAQVKCGPWRFQAYVKACGYVCLPNTLQEGPLKDSIAARVRQEVLCELCDRWECRTKREAGRCE